jgi:hypothetical protein
MAMLRKTTVLPTETQDLLREVCRGLFLYASEEWMHFK